MQDLAVLNGWARLFRNSSLLRRAWQQWVHEHALSKMAAIWCRRAHRALQKSISRQWRASTATRRHDLQQVGMAEAFYAQSLLRRTLARWHVLLEIQRQLLQRTQVSVNHCNRRLLRVVSRSWCLIAKQNSDVRHLLRAAAAALARRSFMAWQQYCWNSRWARGSKVLPLHNASILMRTLRTCAGPELVTNS